LQTNHHPEAKLNTITRNVPLLFAESSEKVPELLHLHPVIMNPSNENERKLIESFFSF